MKTCRIKFQGRDSRRGSTVLVVMALLGIMMALIAANAMSVHALKGELQLLDRKQQHHWERVAPK